MNVNYAELTWVDIKQAVAEDAIAILPTGCIEQHGPHLPLDCDCGSVAPFVERAGQEHGVKALLLPVVPYGPAPEHMSFSGTISISYETWLRYMGEILDSLLHHGFRRILLLRGCGGHFGLETAVYERWVAQRRKGKDVRMEIAPIFAGTPQVQEVVHRHFPDIADVHAGEFETSIALANRPHLVAKDRIPAEGTTQLPGDGCWWALAEELSECGATGNPARASAEAGREIHEALGGAFIEWLADFDARTKR